MVVAGQRFKGRFRVIVANESASIVLDEPTRHIRGHDHARLPFRKMNGLGNEIVVVDLRGTPRVLERGRGARHRRGVRARTSTR